MIRTDRLVLREGRPDDLAPLHEIFSSPLAMRYWDRPPYTEISQSQEFLDAFIKADPATQYEFILECDGLCIGKAGVWSAPEIGYILHPDYWRKGLAFEALSEIIPRAFTALPGIDRLTAELDPRNTGSWRLLEKLGFRRTHVIEKNFLYGEDEWCDTAYYELPRPLST